VTGTRRLEFGLGQDADSACQWDIKHQLFILAEVLAVPSAFLFLYIVTSMGCSCFPSMLKLCASQMAKLNETLPKQRMRVLLDRICIPLVS